MKRLAIVIGIALIATLLGGFATAMPEKIATDHDVYAEGEPIHVEISDCNPNSTYLLEARNGGLYDRWYIDTNANGVGYRVIRITDANKYTLNLKYPANPGGSVVAQKNITVLPLTFEIEPSMYTHSYTYVPGDVIWTHVVAVPDREYIVNITFGNREIFSKNFTTDSNGEYVLKINLPESIDDGDNYKINLLTANEEYITHIDFKVRSIVINAKIERDVYLTGDVLNVYYSVIWIKNGTKVPDRRNEAIIYLDGGETDYKEISTSSGVIQFDLSIYKKHGVITPDNPWPYRITIWYNLSEYPKRFDDATVTFYTGKLNCKINVAPLSGGFFADSDIEIDINSVAQNTYHGSSPVSYAKINYVKIEKSEHWMKEELPIQNVPSQTGYDGKATIIYHLPSDLNVSTEIIITANISVGNEYVEDTYTFSIDTGANLVIHLDKTRYLSGDTMTVTLELQGAAGIGSPTAYHLEVYTEDNVLIYYADSNSNTFTVNIPEDIISTVYVSGTIYTDMGFMFSDTVSVQVSYAYLDIVLSKSVYLPGDEITITAHVDSKVMTSGITYTYVIYADGLLSENVTTTQSEISFTVPEENTPSIYTIMVSATSGNYVIKNFANAYLYSGYIVEVNVDTPSAYQTNVYTPGQKITFRYNIKVSGDVSSNIMILHYYIPNTGYEWYKKIDSLSGKVTVTIPKDLSGSQTFVFEVLTENAPCIPGAASIYVDKTPPWGAFNVGGMSLMDLVLLILVLLAIVLGVIALRGGLPRLPKIEKEEKKKKGAPKPWQPEEEAPAEEEMPAEVSEEEEELVEGGEIRE